MPQLTQCPVCNSGSIVFVLRATDHTVSHESFAIWKCHDCEAMFTMGAPGIGEIGKYYQSAAYISHSDSKEGVINTLYHKIRSITLSGKRNLLRSATGHRKGSVLDIGCGTGAFLHTMQQAGWSITGLEPDFTARKNAESLYHIKPLLPTALFELPAESFHAITMWHVLEHVHQLHDYVERIKDLLADNGKLFIAVPNYISKDASVYKEYWAAYDVPRHLYHFSPASMKKLVLQHGMKVTSIKPMWFDSYYVSMLSEQYRNGKGNIIKAFCNGLLSNIRAFFNTEKCSSVIYVIEKGE